MAIGHSKYSRTFTSQTEKTDISSHGSSEWEDYQEISEEDKEIRKEINEKFGFDLKENAGRGFDGKVLYFYRISDNLCSLEESSQNIEYQTKISLQKAGNKKDLSSWSDLEKFLIKNGFKQLE